MKTGEKKETRKEINVTSTPSALNNNSFGVETIVNRIKQELDGHNQEDKEKMEDRQFILVFILVLLNGFFIYMLINLL